VFAAGAKAADVAIKEVKMASFIVDDVAKEQYSFIVSLWMQKMQSYRMLLACWIAGRSMRHSRKSYTWSKGKKTHTHAKSKAHKFFNHP